MLKIAINTIAVGAAFGATAYAGPEGMPGNISVPVILAQVTPEKPAPVNPAPSTSGSPFDAGLADRRAYEEWFASLTGDFKRGVEYWAGQRSLERPGSCYLADGTSAGEWTKGCVAAQRQFAPSDVRRKAEPDYRQGWNACSPPVAPPPAATATPPAAEPSRAYAEGLADRQAWEHYFGTLSGPEKEGAEWWASHRSDPNNPSCFALKTEQYQNPKVGEVITGCLSAKLQLDPTDKRRLAEPDYRQGWRSYTEPAASLPTASSLVASTPGAGGPALEQRMEVGGAFTKQFATAGTVSPAPASQPTSSAPVASTPGPTAATPAPAAAAPAPKQWYIANWGCEPANASPEELAKIAVKNGASVDWIDTSQDSPHVRAFHIKVGNVTMDWIMLDDQRGCAWIMTEYFKSHPNDPNVFRNLFR
jgi:hypothetical protein